MSIRLQISAMVFLMVQAVLFGVGTIAILSSPLGNRAMFYLAAMIAVSVIVSAALSWAIAPRLRLRYWRDRGVGHDIISG